jgi:hypothetical protein
VNKIRAIRSKNEHLVNLNHSFVRRGDSKPPKPIHSCHTRLLHMRRSTSKPGPYLSPCSLFLLLARAALLSSPCPPLDRDFLTKETTCTNELTKKTASYINSQKRPPSLWRHDSRATRDTCRHNLRQHFSMDCNNAKSSSSGSYCHAPRRYVEVAMIS